MCVYRLGWGEGGGVATGLRFWGGGFFKGGGVGGAEVGEWAVRCERGGIAHGRRGGGKGREGIGRA